MSTNITIDRAGRVVIPKAVREGLRLSPGDSLALDTSDNQIVLTPVRPRATLIKKQGIWVHQSGDVVSEESVLELIDRVRNERIDSFLP